MDVQGEDGARLVGRGLKMRSSRPEEDRRVWMGRVCWSALEKEDEEVEEEDGLERAVNVNDCEMWW